MKVFKLHQGWILIDEDGV